MCTVKLPFLAMTMVLIMWQHFIDKYIDQMVSLPILFPIKIMGFKYMMIAR